MLRTLRVWLGFDHLTYGGMFRLAGLVLGLSVTFALLQIEMGWGIDVLERARARYLGGGLAAGERYLSSHLEERPALSAGFVLLARSRGRFERMARQEQERGSVDYRNPGRQETALALPPGYLKPYLSGAEFEAFLDRSVAVDPRLLALYRRGELEHPDRVAEQLPGVLQSLRGELRGPALAAALVGAGDLCRTYRLWPTALANYRAALALAEADRNESGAGPPADRNAANPGADAAAAKATADFDPDETRRAILETLLESDATAQIAALLAEEEYRRSAGPGLLYRYHLQREEYAEVILPLVRHELETALKGEWIGALVVGLGWLLFLLHMGRAFDRGPSWLARATAALALGVGSAMLTLYVVIVQEHIFGPASEDRGLVFNLVNAVFGIGLREELIKILFAAPLALLLLRESDPLKIFTLTSLVGLGFAVTENVNYYVYGGGTVVSRFLTANFLHMTLTGYAGYYLVRAVQGKDKWENFSESFFIMVLCHGLYDFFLIEPSLAEYSFLAYIVYIWIAQKYLRLLVSLRHRNPGESSLTQMFILALTIAVGVGYWQLARTVGFVQGLFDAFEALLGVAIILFMFFREFNEPVS